MAEQTSASKPVEDLEEEENTITLEEFLEEEQRLETDANAVLGPSDDKNCTYTQGYVNRQALYACVTCLPQDKENAKPAGVCLACSYHCHEGHDLIELYTKRNFRCDCGNSLFSGKKCSLESEKDDINAGNNYNQNFLGVYCICARPYPDPEDSVPDEMLQCIVCEDWYHTRHLGSDVPPGENYAELICGACTDKLPFLNYYMGNAVTKGITSDTSADSNIDVSNNDQTESQKIESESSTSEEDKKTAQSDIANGASPSNSDTKDCIDCLLKTLKSIERVENGATFWPANFRSLLCSCQTCKANYHSLGVSWITDPNDTVQAYEEKGKKENESSSVGDQVLKILSGMDRFQQVEAIHSYNELKTNLVEYLTKFAQNKKVVREEDIREFFSELQARKRQKLNTPPYMCR